MGREDEPIWKPTLWGDPLNWLIEQLWNKPMRWRHQWRWRHNPAPELNDQPVLDNRGRTYWLRVIEAPPCIYLKVFQYGDQAGYVYLSWNPNEQCLSLDDISLLKEHRAHGLGTLLVTRVEQTARKLNATRIAGRVVDDDLKAFSGLLRWYQRQGFDIKTPLANDDKNTVARIEKVIEKQ